MGSKFEADNHNDQLHVFFFPYMAHGHMIPMIEIARLFAANGVKSTVITTPVNASFFCTTINRDRRSGRDINIKIIRFPTTEAGLPEGCETSNSVIGKEMTMNFFKALHMFQEQMEQLLEEYHPDCIVADFFFPWVTDIAAKFEIPRLCFNGTGFFSLCASRVVLNSLSTISSDPESLVVLHDLPGKIEMKRSQIPDDLTLKIVRPAIESELTSYGVLVNSFYELEPAYVEYYRKVMGIKAWHIGPVSLIVNKNNIDKARRIWQEESNNNYMDDDQYSYNCLNWLEGKKPNTVLYVCFGSLSHFVSAQLVEIALGLEASGFPFIWVINKFKKGEEEQQKFGLPKGFEERIEGRGLIIKDWAPQMLILDHPAIGGFMTHCGWNSILEGVSSGVPLITWPLFAEQFYNEKLVTEVLRIGIQVGVERWSSEKIVDISVKRGRIEKVVLELMGTDGQEAQEMRNRVKELAKKAKKAVEEGGSSYADFTALIEELKACKRGRP